MSYEELYEEDALLRDALKIILTTTGFLEFAQDFTVNFIDENYRKKVRGFEGTYEYPQAT